MTITFAPHLHLDQHSAPEHSEVLHQTSFDPPTARQFDLRIIAFMLLVAVIQLLSFKRPFS